MRIIKQDTCGKVSASDNPTLTYNVCYNPTDKSYLFRVITNNTGGFFSPEWIALDDIEKALSKHDTFSAKILDSLYASKSANNAGFLAAALKAEGILVAERETRRLHKLGDIDDFKKRMQKLLKNDLPDIIVEQQAAKEKAGKK
ncbi:hypothetical protein FE810_15500 [Thalassotalea litorea]|uniref:Uncharacterized protein n=1 Tax=Thalassotalea litorea TaxID=2020715 RepID=A0A5R9ICB8_9GAMM|nr:hypothetical protein [Thalassotalea litorea]TLU61225.1 hypothetical protein FE810_15500 [Thalassotalea litorea]